MGGLSRRFWGALGPSLSLLSPTNEWVTCRFGSDHPTAATRKRIAPYVYEVLALLHRHGRRLWDLRLSIGAMLAGQVYAGGSTRRQLHPSCCSPCARSTLTSIGYIGAQRRFLALLLSRLVIVRPKVIGFPNPGYSVGHAFWAEIFATFFCVLCCVPPTRRRGEQLLRLAIGFTMTAMAVAVVRPAAARSTPLSTAGTRLGGKHYIYWSALIGAILAGCACRRTRERTLRERTLRERTAQARLAREVTRGPTLFCCLCVLPLSSSPCAYAMRRPQLLSVSCRPSREYTPPKARSSIKVAAERKSLVHAEVDPARQSLMKYNPTVAKEEGRERFNSIDEVSLSFDAKALLSSKPPAPKEPKVPKAPAKGEEKEEEALPEGWKIIKDEAGDFEYFYNEESGESVWTREELPMTAEAAKRYEAALNKARSCARARR